MSVGLVLALLLPWLTGALAVRPLADGNHWGVTLGYGYLVGLLLVAAILYVLDVMSLSLSFVAAASALGGIGLLLSLPALRRLHRPRWSRPGLARWQWCLLALLLALLGYRFGVLWLDSWYRPAYAWDTVMNFAPKARVWFEFRQLVPFEYPHEWLGHPLAEAYTLSNSQAVGYPPLVPLVMLWTALGAGEWADNLVTLPWVLCGLALALGVYGQLRSVGIGVLGALLSVYLLLSLPLLGVHVVLGGYADLWVAVGLGLATLAWLRARRGGGAGQWCLMAAMLLVAVLAKRSGLVWVAVMLGCVLLEWLPRRVALALAAGAVLALLAVAMIGGVEFSVPGLGAVEFSTQRIAIPGLVDTSLRFTDISSVLLRSLFLSGNWHLFWYALVALVAWGAVTRRLAADGFGPLLFLLGSMTVFCLIFFALPRYSGEALNQVTLNRALLHLVPAWMLMVCWWYRDWLAGLDVAAERDGGAAG